MVRDLEAHAKQASRPMPDLWGLCMEDVVVGSPKLGKRVIAACDAIVAREQDLADRRAGRARHADDLARRRHAAA